MMLLFTAAGGTIEVPHPCAAGRTCSVCCCVRRKCCRRKIRVTRGMKGREQDYNNNCSCAGRVRVQDRMRRKSE